MKKEDFERLRKMRWIFDPTFLDNNLNLRKKTIPLKQIKPVTKSKK